MNDTIFYFFYNLAYSSLTFDQMVIFMAVYLPYIVVFLAGIFLLFHHEVLFANNPLKAFKQRWKEIFLVFFSGISAWILAYALKYLFHTPRPFDIFSNVSSLFSETGYAFPSGHATFFMALALAIFFNHKKVGYIFIVFALLIGIARIIAGVHFPVDIFGGFILGFLIAFLLKKV
jgi:undecaprenyl-diphosphatase